MFGEKQIATIKMSPRVAVWGGSGFIGSRVCQLLATCGCECISLSRSGGPPAWAVGEAWTADVTWLVADASNGPRHGPGALGQIDAAVSCVGNMRPSSEWEGFWGLHWKYAPCHQNRTKPPGSGHQLVLRSSLLSTHSALPTARLVPESS